MSMSQTFKIAIRLTRKNVTLIEKEERYELSIRHSFKHKVAAG